MAAHGCVLIEDSPTDAAVLAADAARNGHRVLTSGSAEDGIAMVASASKPTTVLMDVVLPGHERLRGHARVVARPATSHIRC